MNGQQPMNSGQKCAYHEPYLIGFLSVFIRQNGTFELQQFHVSFPSFRCRRQIVHVSLLPVKPQFDVVRGLNDIWGRPIVEGLLLVVGVLVGSLVLSLPTIPVAFEGKKGISFSLGGDVIIKWPLLVGWVAIVQAEIAPVRSILTLCGTGSFGQNLVATGLIKL